MNQLKIAAGTIRKAMKMKNFYCQLWILGLSSAIYIHREIHLYCSILGPKKLLDFFYTFTVKYTLPKSSIEEENDTIKRPHNFLLRLNPGFSPDEVQIFNSLKGF